MHEANGLRIRRSVAEDFDAWFALYEAVAAEGRWIGGEAPCDREERRRSFERSLDAEESVTFLCEVDGELVGMLGVGLQRGVAQLGMMVDAAWRGRGVGSMLLEDCIAWASEHGAHKVALEAWPHNAAALALYRKFGFAEEGRFRRHYRRRNGELWDSIAMGLVLDWTSPGSPDADLQRPG